MTVDFTVSALCVDGDPPVRGVLHRVPDSTDALVLAHGAGSDHRAPMLVALADAFARAGVTVLRCDLPFRQLRATGPPQRSADARDRRGLAAALAAVAAYGPRRRYLGGHSYGGRQASMALAESSRLAQGLLLLSYPLHPPDQPERSRTAHLASIAAPALFVHGARDPFGTIQEIERARVLLTGPTALLAVPGAGHALPATDAGLLESIVAAFVRLVD